MTGRTGSPRKGEGEVGQVSEGFKDDVQVEKELEDAGRNDVQEEVVSVDGGEGGEVRIDRRAVSLPVRGD